MAKRKENHYGLKEAYSILQKDFINLQNHCTGIEQHLMAIQNNYLILEQFNQEQQRDAQEEKAKFIEKLEKSYDAFNEKYTEVEMLKEKLNSQNEKNEQLNEERNTRTLQEVCERENQKQIFDEVKKSLSKVGLSLVETSEDFKVNLQDIKKLEQLLCDESRIVDKSVVNKVNDLKETNNILEKALSSLKQHSQSQDKEMSKIREELHKKIEECLNLHEEINNMKNKQESSYTKKQDLTKEALSAGKNIVIVKRDVVEKMVAQLHEMSGFTAELKKTILEQSSWIEVLMALVNDYKENISQRDKGHRRNTQSRVDPRKMYFEKSIESDVPNDFENYHLNTDQSSSKEFTPYQNYPKAFCVSKSHIQDGDNGPRSNELPLSSTECDGGVVDHRGKPRVDPTGSENSELQLGIANIVRSKSHMSYPSSLSGHQNNDVRTDDMYQPSNNDRSVIGSLTQGNDVRQSELGNLTESDGVGQHEMYLASNFDRSVTGCLTQGNDVRQSEMYQASNFDRSTIDSSASEQHYLPTHDMCPMCDVIFDATYDLVRRRSHINGHF